MGLVGTTTPQSPECVHCHQMIRHTASLGRQGGFKKGPIPENFQVLLNNLNKSNFGYDSL